MEMENTTKNILDIEVEYELVTPCGHKNCHLRTLRTMATVEVTAVCCTDCGKQLTEEQWEA
ncbi:MAG: hypothetical protein Q4G08_04090 [Capnocytophaga sp.]|nr:hypothetical protein [Capnocytophaga sp.]